MKTFVNSKIIHIVCYFIFLFTINTADSAVPANERSALESLYNNTNGASWIDNSNWLTGDPCTDIWFGIVCNTAGDSVTEIEFGNFPDGNNLVGVLPNNLGDLINLITLDLRYNSLSGSIPVTIGNLSSLQFLFLSSNQLTGSIPSELGNLINLKFLFLNSNKLTGSIPAEIGNLGSLQILSLIYNQLTGNIPSSLTNLTSVGTNQLDISFNGLYTSDAALDAFLNGKQDGGNWSVTQTIAPSNLAITAVNSNGFSLSWDAIEYTDNIGRYRAWYSTSPTGPYSDGGVTSDKFTTTHTITGLLANTIYYIIVRTETDAHGSQQNLIVSDDSVQLRDTTQPVIERTVLVDLYNATDGASWIDNSNWLSGNPCTNSWFGITCNTAGDSVTKIEFGNFPDGNNLVGVLPDNLGDLINLNNLDLRNNTLSGSIPIEIGNLSNLQFLLLDNNSLTGSIPAELGNLSNLKFLFLNSNQLTSSIPTEIGNLGSLQILSLNSNQLTGNIPNSLTNLTSIGTSLLNINSNGLYTSDTALDAFLDSKQDGGNWSLTQTIAPTNLVITAVNPNDISLSWDAIEFTSNSGRYRAWYSTSQTGPFVDGGATNNKLETTLTILNLIPDTYYYIFMRTETDSHPNNTNDLVSENSSLVTNDPHVFSNGFEDI